MASKSIIVLGFAASLVAAAPCDIYATGGTPCVAAHSTTRALYSSYAGPLYQLSKGYGGATTNIYPITAGGVANSSAQDAFCSGSSCLIATIYDQSGHGNDLTQAPPGNQQKGPRSGGYDNLASATAAPVYLGGKKVYGTYIAPGTGYRKPRGNGTATGDNPEGIYAVLDGTVYNYGCCFDYGNAETSSEDTGAGHMEAIYFGKEAYWGSGAGSGPWIMADLENGLFAGQGAGKVTTNPSINHRFVTAVVKGKPGTWAIRGADATSGSISTFYEGARPNGYNPMHKEGSIILGIGGDNSNSATGTFYEGAMTSGYPSDSTEAQIQADLVAAKYTTS